MANTENFPNTGKKKTRHRRYDRCYTELLRLLTKHRFRFTVEPLKEPVRFEDQYHRVNKYPTYNLDTRITIYNGTRRKKIVVYIAPNLDALVDPKGEAPRLWTVRRSPCGRTTTSATRKWSTGPSKNIFYKIHSFN